MCLSIVCGSCTTPPPNRLQILDYRDSGPAVPHFEDFDEAVHRVSPDGLVDVILRKRAAGGNGSGRRITQTIHVSAYWKPFPGRTHAEDSMLNAHIRYVLEVGRSVSGYHGGGFVQYGADPSREEVRGFLEGGDLRPLSPPAGNGVFQRVGMWGRFRSRLDARRATRAINRINHVLGPTGPQAAAAGPAP